MWPVLKKKGKKRKTASKPAPTPWRPGTWVGLLVFVSVWMFIFGILVGRGTVTTEFEFDDSQKELYTMAEESAKEAERQDPTQNLGEEMASDPFVGLKDADPGEIKQVPRLVEKKIVTATKTPVPSVPSKKTKNSKASNSTSPPSPSSSSSVKAKPPPAPIKPRKASEKNRRTLQTASMQNLGEAKRMVAQLRQKGYNAYVASAAVSGRGLRHRVRIGPYKNEKDANAALTRLKQAGVQAIILKK